MSNWHKAPRWRKRIEGFFCYQFAAFLSLINPERADLAIYLVLRDQFALIEESLPSRPTHNGSENDG